MVEDTKDARLRRWVRWLTLGGSVSFVAMAGPSCAYDKNNPCGDDLVVDFDANGNRRCVCPVGTFYSASGCITCGENEFLQGDVCVCQEGFAKPTPDDACEEVVDTSSTSTSTTGTTIGSGGAGNTGNGANNTTGGGGAAGASGEGGESGEDTDSSSTEGSTTGGGTTATSTTGSVAECAVNEDCVYGDGSQAEICDAGVCRPPTGWWAMCDDSSECAGYEADFCDTYQHKCTISNCTNTPDTCPAGFQCCDLSGFPGFAIMCIPTAGYCPTPAP